MQSEIFRHEYDLAALAPVTPASQEFAMYVTPRYREHYALRPYEAFTARLLSRLLASRSLFVDVGANYGFYTLLAAKRYPHLRVMALEPVAETLEALKRSTQALGVRNVEFYQVAAAAADGTAPFNISAAADNCGFSPHPAAPPLRQVEVRTARLDSLLADQAPCPAAIKIDVEGHELQVLAGMESTLKRFEDLVLVIELNPKMQRAAGHEPGELLRELDRQGMAIFVLDDERGLAYRLKPGSEWSQFVAPEGYANLYCVRKNFALSVCLFAHSADLGGAERSILQLVKDLISDHAAVCSVVLPAPGSFMDALLDAGAGCLVSPYSWWCDIPPARPDPAAPERLKPALGTLMSRTLPVLAHIDPDVLMTVTLTVPWGAVAAALLGKPHVWSVHEYGERDHDLRFFFPFEKVLQDVAASSAFIYTCGEKLGTTLFPKLGSDRRRTRHTHVSIPEALPEPSGPGPYSAPGAARLGLFASLQESKGQEDAILAVAELLQQGYRVELLLAGQGQGDYRARLARLIEQHGLTNQVIMPGFLADPYSAMRQTDIVLACSRHEAFGRTVVEAMLLGKPVVYAAAGGFVESMIADRTGLPYPPGDAAALASQIRRLL